MKIYGVASANQGMAFFILCILFKFKYPHMAVAAELEGTDQIQSIWIIIEHSTRHMIWGPLRA